MKRKGNQYILYDTYAEIIIESEKYGTFYAKIDLDDVEKCRTITWNVNKFGNKQESEKYFYYAVNAREGMLHSFVFGKKKGCVTDHKNLDTMDNRKGNLRFATYSQNNMNRGFRANNTNGKIGVVWVKKLKKWMAHIGKNRKKINLGYYDNIEDAVKARKEGEIKYFGKYRYESDE